MGNLIQSMLWRIIIIVRYRLLQVSIITELSLITIIKRCGPSLNYFRVLCRVWLVETDTATTPILIDNTRCYSLVVRLHTRNKRNTSPGTQNSMCRFDSASVILANN